MSDQPLSPAEQVRCLYGDAENRTSTAMESLVASDGFGEILSMVTGNAMAVTRSLRRPVPVSRALVCSEHAMNNTP